MSTQSSFLKIFTFLIVSVTLAGFYSCHNVSEPQKKHSDDKLAEALIKANIAAVQFEDEQVKSFIERRRWNMEKTGSGLRYMIYHFGDGPKAEKEKIVRIRYNLSSLSGDTFYSSEQNAPLEFQLGKGGVESGLEEAILLLSVGDQAKFIIPSHLGFGLAGDNRKIPPKTTLIYDVELLLIK